MSSKLHGLVWEGCAHAGLILSRVAVMARLADYSNNEGLSWPAVETIQREIGAKSTTTVSTAITELERGGWLVRTERKAGGRNLSNLYQINVEKLELAAVTAREEYRRKKRGGRVIPPIVDPSNIDPPTVDPSTVGKNGEFNPPMVDPDPSLKPDPSDQQIFLSENSHESSDRHKLADFKSRHPDAEVFTPSGKSWGTKQDLECAAWVFGRIRILNPTAKQPNWTEWANDIRLMRQLDGRTHRDIAALFKRANRDDFWRKNILSPAKLRAKWDDLIIKLGDQQNASNTGESTAVQQVRAERERWDRERRGASMATVGPDDADLREPLDCEEWKQTDPALDHPDWEYDQRPDDERL